MKKKILLTVPALALSVLSLASCDLFNSDKEGTTQTLPSTTDVIPSTTETDTECKTHTWSEPTYRWLSNNNKVKARRVCTKCGKEDEEIQTTTSVIKKEATCSQEGKVLYTSEEFDNPAFEIQEKEVTLEKTEHTPGITVELDRVDATCETDGYITNRNVCSVCGETINQSVTPLTKTGHDYSTYEIVTKPTTTETGKVKFICSHNPNHVLEYDLPKIFEVVTNSNTDVFDSFYASNSNITTTVGHNISVSITDTFETRGSSTGTSSSSESSSHSSGTSTSTGTSVSWGSSSSTGTNNSSGLAISSRTNILTRETAYGTIFASFSKELDNKLEICSYYFDENGNLKDVYFTVDAETDTIIQKLGDYDLTLTWNGCSNPYTLTYSKEINGKLVSFDKTYEALGHQYNYTQTVKPSLTQNEVLKGTCCLCGATTTVTGEKVTSLEITGFSTLNNLIKNSNSNSISTTFSHQSYGEIDSLYHITELSSYFSSNATLKLSIKEDKIQLKVPTASCSIYYEYGSGNYDDMSTFYITELTEQQPDEYTTVNNYTGISTPGYSYYLNYNGTYIPFTAVNSANGYTTYEVSPSNGNFDLSKIALTFVVLESRSPKDGDIIYTDYNYHAVTYRLN